MEVNDNHWAKIPLPHVPAHYEASRDGFTRIREYTVEYTTKKGTPVTRTNPGKVLQPRINNDAPSRGKNPVVWVYDSSLRRNRPYRVALLVAAAHLGLPYNPSDACDVQGWRLRFKDGDFTNCAADNLEWVRRNGVVSADGEAQRRYERNLDGFRSSNAEDVLARLFAEAS